MDIAEDILPDADHPPIGICQIWDPQEQKFMGPVQKHTADVSGKVNLPLVLHPQIFMGDTCRDTYDGKG